MLGLSLYKVSGQQIVILPEITLFWLGVNLVRCQFKSPVDSVAVLYLTICSAQPAVLLWVTSHSAHTRQTIIQSACNPGKSHRK